jgi:hypothetical protein
MTLVHLFRLIEVLRSSTSSPEFQSRIGDCVDAGESKKSILEMLHRKLENDVDFAMRLHSESKPPESPLAPEPLEEPGKIRSGRAKRSDWGTGLDACAVRIGRSDRAVKILDTEKRGLSRAQIRVLQVLRKAGPAGLTLSQMRLKLGTTSGRTTIDRLRKDPDWERAILKAGRSHDGYRLASVRAFEG